MFGYIQLVSDIHNVFYMHVHFMYTYNAYAYMKPW